MSNTSPHATGRRALIFAALILAFGISTPAIAGVAPTPPCDTTPAPLYPGADESPLVQVWAPNELPAAWMPPGCTGWKPTKFQLLLSLAGRFHSEQGAEGLLRGFGAISSLLHVQYWSITDKRMQNLFSSAIALEGPDVKRRRQDFTAEEMMSGQDLYFAQKDNRSSSDVVYRLRVSKMRTGGFVVEMENITAVKFLMLKVFQPGALQSIFYLEQTAPAEWTYYNLVRIGPGLSLFATNRDSYINRALALFYHTAAIPRG